MVEWIEIGKDYNTGLGDYVSTLVVEWIEILYPARKEGLFEVSTLVVEWIEIGLCTYCSSPSPSPPSWWSGLKFSGSDNSSSAKASPPSWWSGLKLQLTGKEMKFVESLHPRGGVD